jgi:hypothetical protein
VPLPESTLQSLRRHWVTRRHPRFILLTRSVPGPQLGLPKASTASSVRLAGPFLGPSFQGAFRQAKWEVRHRLCLDSYTKPFLCHLEAGVNLRGDPTLPRPCAVRK